MDIVIINHHLGHIYTNCAEALEGGRRQDIEKVYSIDPNYQFIPCLYMPEQFSGLVHLNMIKIEDVRGAAVLIVEFSLTENLIS